MAEAGLQTPDIPAPPPLRLSQFLHTSATTCTTHTTSTTNSTFKLVTFKPEFQENQKKMQKPIYLELTVG